MRVTDQAPPVIPAHVIPPGMPSASWGATPVVGLEYLPDADLWDDIDPDVVWDDIDVTFVWDDPAIAAGYTDVWCDVAGIDIIHGEPDDADLYPPSSCTLTLYDPAKRYRRRGPDGRLVYYAAGRRVAVLAVVAGERWWLFSGRVATWHEEGDFVEIVAYSRTAALAQDPGYKWTAGAAGDKLPARTAAILTAAGSTAVTRVDPGLATFVVPAADKVAPLEALQRMSWSDGGVVYTDPDDTLVIRDRGWRDGRLDQPVPPVAFTDNVCTGGAVVLSDIELDDDDAWLAARVVLSTDAGLVATASNPAEAIDASLVYTHPDTDLWRTQAEGDALAAQIANVHGRQRPALSLGRLYLHDVRTDNWAVAVNVRVGDLMTWQHEDRPDAATLVLYEVPAIIDTVRHLLTAETWILELGTTPATGARTVEEWDVTAYLWDTAAADNVWR